MDCYFVKLMLDQLKHGNMIRNTFSKTAWNHMLKFFNQKFDAQYDTIFLKHRYNKLGNRYADIKNLLELKDFSWDENQQRIVADDYVWDNYIKVCYYVLYITMELIFISDFTTKCLCRHTHMQDTIGTRPWLTTKTWG